MRSSILLGCLASLPALAAPLLELRLAGQPLQVELAVSQAERQQGLMQRTELAPERGMLFVFPQARRQCLWMKNTLVPLSAAFLDEAGRVINLVDLQPHDLQLKCSASAARYAVEANQGWFAAHGVRPGASVEGLPAD